jgi:hypothetical protein
MMSKGDRLGRDIHGEYPARMKCHTNNGVLGA